MEEWINVAEQNNLPLKIQQAAYDIAKQDIEAGQGRTLSDSRSGSRCTAIRKVSVPRLRPGN